MPRHVQDAIGRQLNELIPEIDAVEDDTRLGQVLLRLRAALLDAEAERQVTKSFGDELIALVPRLRRFALVRTAAAAQADDLVQATLLKAWEHRFRFEDGTNLIAWLFTILRNTHLNQSQRMRREIEDVDGAIAGTLSSAPDQEHRIALSELQGALETLPEDQRETLLLVTVDGLRHEEAAAILGCQVGTVKSRVSRARERFATALGLS
ncbi:MULTISPECIES: sigma-70 family RNA polymerase sigma factor [unclassified Methylobacterium]|uniref:sigma-70 family RNA polymerase sigma factor n=1 Tax=unclassified Methylobacterium TaxID=2615210 RepID=UPI0011C1D462|nr:MULTISPECIES: sigma-70 family RNA polymerase sigma factor [unclassified Methylobacterium]QEE41143.1 sigma-70 family RNA polymerase sigma factor [Methylobacterium sp. WL1]TXN53905.1 sigma-70 family RNA polymerase sigma factor [Methylobacterium sp. WL2]